MSQFIRAAYGFGTALAVLLASGANAQAPANGDVFNTNSTGNACEQARAAEQATYERNIAAIERMKDAPHQPGQVDVAALRRYAARKGDEETRHQKALVDLSVGVCSVLRPSSNSPCDMARYQEEVTYGRNMAQLEKRRLDEDNQHNRERLACADDWNCWSASDNRAMARLRAWAADRDKENDRHSKAIDDIQQGKCSIHGTANPTNTPPDTGGLPLPPETRKQLLKGAAAMDKLLTKGQNATLAGANRFFACLAEAVRSDLRFLAQPGYVPAAQIAQALHEGTWRYLTGNAYANNRALFDGALQSLRQLRDDPACWFGNAAPGAAVGVVTHYAGAAAEAAEVQNAEKAAVRIANEYEERRGYGSSSMGRRGAPNPSNPFNPANAPNMCFPCALAKDLTLETGDPHWAQAYAGNVEIQQINGVPTPVYNITHDPTVHAILRDFYGEKQLQGAPLPPWRLTNQARGIPSAVTDQYGNGLGGVAARRAIESEMKAAGNGSRGLVFLDYPPTPQNPAGTGHVVNVRFVNGRVLFEDASNNNINASMFFNAAAKVSLFRTN